MSNQKTTPMRKPVPVRDAGTAGFFDGAREGRLRVQRCQACGHHCLLGTKYCPQCQGLLQWVPASGKGILHTFALVHQKLHPAFAEDLPYPIGTAKLQEGPMLTLRLVDVLPADLHVGMPLKVRFISNENAEATPVFEPDRG